jgi:hypothetical protein
MRSDRGEGVEEARKQLRDVAAELEALAYRLLGVHASLPESAAERVLLLDADEMGPAAEVRALIECVLNDWLQPAVHALRNAADPPAAEAERGDP